MEMEQFDEFTRRLSGAGSSRRQALRAVGATLLGGAITGVVARLGLAEVTAAKGKKHKAKSNQKRVSRAERKTQGAVQAEGKGKKKGNGKKKPKSKPNPCGPNQRYCRDDDLCVPTTSCCPGTKFCAGDGCIPDNECCDNLSPLCQDCHEPFCDNGIWTCRNDTKQKCPDGTCVPFTECCPDRKRCPGGDGRCIPKDSCCAGEKPCDDGTCIPSNQCCPITEHGCHGCSEPFCDNGIWGCRPKCGGANYCCGNQCIPNEQCCGDPPDCGPCYELACGGGLGGWYCKAKACCPPGYLSCPPNVQSYGGCCEPDNYYILNDRPFCNSYWGATYCDI